MTHATQTILNSTTPLPNTFNWSKKNVKILEKYDHSPFFNALKIKDTFEGIDILIDDVLYKEKDIEEVTEQLTLIDNFDEKRYRHSLLKLQAHIHELRATNPSTYQQLKARHQHLSDAFKAFFFCLDYPELYNSIDCPFDWYYEESCRNLGSQTYGWYGISVASYLQGMLIHNSSAKVLRTKTYTKTYINPTSKKAFIRAYHLTVKNRDSKNADVLPALLAFIRACMTTDNPQYIIDLLADDYFEQAMNRQLFNVLGDFEHQLYVDWLVNHSNFDRTMKPLLEMAERYPEVVINSIIFDIVANPTSQTTHLLQVISLNLYNQSPERFDTLYHILQTQQPKELTAKVADIFTQVRQIGLKSTSNESVSANGSKTEVKSKNNDVLDKTNLKPEASVPLSKWLTTPPWEHKEYNLRAPKLDKKVAFALLPKPIFKVDGSELSLPMLENLVGILYKSDLEGLVEPLTEADMADILAPFTRDSLNLLGNALAVSGMAESKIWLTNENSVPTDTFDRQTVRILGASVKFWYPILKEDEQSNPYADQHIKKTVQLLLHLLAKGKQGTKPVASRCLDELEHIMQLNTTELHDLAVPNLAFDGFDNNGEQIFELNSITDKDAQLTSPSPTKIIVRIDTQLTLELFDQNHDPLPRFPRAKKGDDKARFKQVNTDIKALQKQLNKIYKTLNERFEREMTNSVKERPSQLFESSEVIRRDEREAATLKTRSPQFMWQYFAKHPILKQYLTTLLWSVIDDKQDTIATFIMTVDGALINADYEAYDAATIQGWQKVDKSSDKQVHITHPAFLSDHDREQWQQLLSDSEIMQPFNQLQHDSSPPRAKPKG